MSLRIARQIFGVAAALTVLLLGTQAEAQSESPPKDIVSFIPDGPILLPGIKFPYFDPDQLTGGDPKEIVAIEELWAVYVFYHDTQDGERFASLFTPDGVFDQELNQNGTFIPNSGVSAKGCVLQGRKSISNFIYLETKNTPALTFPHPVHKSTGLLIKVDGNEASLIAQLGFRSGGGVYMVKLRKTNEGWRIKAEHLVYEKLNTAQEICDLNGSPPGGPTNGK